MPRRFLPASCPVVPVSVLPSLGCLVRPPGSETAEGTAPRAGPGPQHEGPPARPAQRAPGHGLPGGRGVGSPEDHVKPCLAGRQLLQAEPEASRALSMLFLLASWFYQPEICSCRGRAVSSPAGRVPGAPLPPALCHSSRTPLGSAPDCALALRPSRLGACNNTPSPRLGAMERLPRLQVTPAAPHFCWRSFMTEDPEA